MKNANEKTLPNETGMTAAKPVELTDDELSQATGAGDQYKTITGSRDPDRSAGSELRNRA